MKITSGPKPGVLFFFLFIKSSLFYNSKNQLLSRQITMKLHLNLVSIFNRNVLFKSNLVANFAKNKNKHQW